MGAAPKKGRRKQGPEPDAEKLREIEADKENPSGRRKGKGKRTPMPK